MKVFALFCLCLGSAIAFPEYEQSCEGKADPGMCLAYMPMFYYDADTNTCKQFIYGGCQGNGNRYPTKEQCEQKCKVYIENTDEDICSLPAEEGMCRGYFPFYYFDAKSGKCKEMIYGGCGGNENRFATKDACEQRCSPALGAVRQEKSCKGKGETGLCKAYFPMFYYDSETGTCKQFIYGGCGGNNNRYATEAECLQNCRQVSRDVCSLEPETGPCMAYFRKYYFDSTTGQCKEFTYGGCRGNGNRFDTMEDCYSACSTKRPVTKDACLLDRETGPCKASMRKYYYDRTTGQCELFIYGGCGGNANKFDTIDECRRTCSVARAVEYSCEGEPETGPCRGAFTRFYYDKETNTCKEFIFGGCERKPNNYILKESCEDACVN